MSTNKQQHDNIQQSYFERTPAKNWKLGDAIMYYLQQNVPTNTVYDLIQKSLEKCMTRESLEKHCLAMMQEVTIITTVNQSLATSTTSSEKPVTLLPTEASSSSPKIATLVNNYGSINQTNNINQLGKRKKSSQSSLSNKGDKEGMDGIGFSVEDKAERLIIECSGEVDGQHTEEDTLKLMEATSRCLKNEMGRYQASSWVTFGRRKVLAVQAVNDSITLLSTQRVEGNKWAFIEQRSALVPRDWGDRVYWIKVVELLLKLNELLIEQEEVTRKLKEEYVGLIKVNPEDTIKHALSKIDTN